MGLFANCLHNCVREDRLRPKVFWLFFFAFCVIAAGLGLRDPQPADEPRFVLVAKDMVEQGHWFFPQRGQELYADKPPLFMWLQAGFFYLVGSWRIAFLLPSLLASIGTLICVYDLSRRLWTRRIGCIAVIALLLAFQFTYQSKRAQIDALLVFFITLSNYGLLRHILLGRSWIWWVIGWSAAGLGTISKGVGFLSLLILMPAAIASTCGWPHVKIHATKWQFWLGPLCFILTVSLWLGPLCFLVLTSHRPEYFQYLHEILFHQTAQRYAHSWDHTHSQFYFLKVMLIYWLPPVLALPWAIPHWYRRWHRQDPRFFLPLAWIFIVFVFFSIPDGKRDMYVLPALPMLCICLAPLIPGILRQPIALRVLQFFTFILIFTLLLAGLVIMTYSRIQTSLIDGRGLDIETVRWIGLGFAVIACIGAYSFKKWAKRAAHIPLIIVIFSGWILVSLVIFPCINNASSSKNVMRAVSQRLGPADQLGLIAWKEQNLLMAARPVTTFGFLVPWQTQFQQGVSWQAREPSHRWLLIQEPALQNCVMREKSVMVGASNRRRWWLVPSGAIRPQCQPNSGLGVQKKFANNSDTD